MLHCFCVAHHLNQRNMESTMYETKIASLVKKLTDSTLLDAAQTVFESVREGNSQAAMAWSDYLSSLAEKLDEHSDEYKIVQAIDAWVLDKCFETDFRANEKLDEVMIGL